jgi:hypothetical protein
MMTLAGTKDVVYLQSDPGMYSIGNILRRLTKSKDESKTYLQAPLPISASDIGLDVDARLEAKFKEFEKEQSAKTGAPFAKLPKDKWTASITSFLCTDDAYDVFRSGHKGLEELARQYAAGKGFGNYCPKDSKFANCSLVKEALDFYEYVQTKGDRATPHRS